MPRQKRHYRNITRVDHVRKRTHGWYVRIRYAGKSVAKMFTDKNYGSRRAALQAAIEYRNEAERELGRPRTDRLVIGSTRTRTGVIGVQRMMKRSKSRKGTVNRRPVYEVTWSPAPNVLQRTSFAITKYGEEEAFRRAVELRRQKEIEVFQPYLLKKRRQRQSGSDS